MAENRRNRPPRDPTQAYVYRKRKDARRAPDWVDVGQAFEAGRRYEKRRRAQPQPEKSP